MMGSAAALGVLLAYGARKAVRALQACERGEATPVQQKIVAQLLRAAIETESKGSPESPRFFGNDENRFP